uniref:Low-temperature-induced 65 kDa protein n=1 Tax=Kalanchoe fedtschenkoi TaxID=63787 RepID=A0A7N0VBE3_KALFE
MRVGETGLGARASVLDSKDNVADFGDGAEGCAIAHPTIDQQNKKQHRSKYKDFSLGRGHLFHFARGPSNLRTGPGQTHDLIIRTLNQTSDFRLQSGASFIAGPVASPTGPEISLCSKSHATHLVYHLSKSVLKKVKAKAKQIKETIKKHGHLHGHEHDRDHDQPGRDPKYDEEDEDDDDDEEVEKDPEIHGAPIYESQVARNPVVGSEASQGLHHHQPNLERTDEPAVGRDHARLGVPMSHAHQGLGMDAGVIGGSTIGRLIIPEEAPVAPRNTPISHSEDQPRVEEKLPVPSLEEDPGGPRHTLSEPYRPGNYQAKVSNPTGAGAEETPGIAPLLRSLDKMSVDEPEPKSQPVGSHDKFSPKTERESKYRDMPDDSPLITGEAVQQDIAPQGGYTEKLAFVTAALADKVVAAKDAAASKLGYGDEKTDEAPSDQTSYTEKASHAASLLADKAIGAKDAVASKLGYGGTGEHKTPREPVDHEALIRQQQSSYTERLAGVTADVTSALAEKAAEVKNVVASKLGYDQEGAGAGKASDPDHAAPSQGSVASSIADKAAQVKSAVASKLGYTGEGVTASECGQASDLRWVDDCMEMVNGRCS